MNHATTSLIGPHEGQELQLMLQRRKQIAYFAEADPAAEFAPHVARGEIVRHVWPEKNALLLAAGYPPALVEQLPPAVFYYMPGSDYLLMSLKQALTGLLSATSPTERQSYDAEIGRLLGYSEEAIKAFLAQG